VRHRLLDEEKQRKAIENELVKLKRAVPENENDFEVSCYMHAHYHNFLLVF
jgi:kinesin family protein 5